MKQCENGSWADRHMHMEESYKQISDASIMVPVEAGKELSEQ